jgi:hypothetical protein
MLFACQASPRFSDEPVAKSIHDGEPNALFSNMLHGRSFLLTDRGSSGAVFVPFETPKRRNSSLPAVVFWPEFHRATRTARQPPVKNRRVSSGGHEVSPRSVLSFCASSRGRRLSDFCAVKRWLRTTFLSQLSMLLDSL